MTRHEFHIALLLIALIAGGVIGYQVMHSGGAWNSSNKSAEECSRPTDNHAFDTPMEIEPPANRSNVLDASGSAVARDGKLHQHSLKYIPEEGAKSGNHLLESIRNLRVGHSGAGQRRTASNGRQQGGDVRVSERIRLITPSGRNLVYPSGGSTTFEELMNFSKDEVQAPVYRKDVDQNQNLQQTENVVITQMSNNNIAVIVGTGDQNLAGVRQEAGDANIVQLAQVNSGNRAELIQIGEKNQVAGTGTLYPQKPNPGLAIQYAQSTLKTEQTGALNRADLLQDESMVTLLQEGVQNDTNLYQHRSEAEVLQRGEANETVVEQAGGSARIYQEGEGNSLFLSQM